MANHFLPKIVIMTPAPIASPTMVVVPSRIKRPGSIKVVSKPILMDCMKDLPLRCQIIHISHCCTGGGMNEEC